MECENEYINISTVGKNKYAVSDVSKNTYNKNLGNLITILIPTFNRKEKLQKAVQSVITQNAPWLTIHIFDNCSDDGTADIVAELKARHHNIQYTRRNENIGGLRNYAEAIASVETPYFIPLADDDWLLAGSINLLYKAIVADDSLGSVVSQTCYQSPDGATTFINPENDWIFKRYEPEEFLPLWVRKGHFAWSSIMFRTDAKDLAGGLDVKTGSPSDVDFQLQVFLRYPTKMIKHPSAVYNIHPNQYSAQIDASRSLGVFRMIEKAKVYVDSLETRSPILRASVVEFGKNWSLDMARELAQHAKLSDFMKIYSVLVRDYSHLGLKQHFKFCYLKAKARKCFSDLRSQLPRHGKNKR